MAAGDDAGTVGMPWVCLVVVWAGDQYVDDVGRRDDVTACAVLAAGRGGVRADDDTSSGERSDVNACAYDG